MKRLSSHRLLRVVLRLAAWFIALAVALFPAFVASRNLPHTVSLFELGRLLYANGHFADFYFAGMIMSAFSLSNLWENIITKFLWDTIESGTKTIAILAAAIFPLFLIFLFYGLMTYMTLIRDEIILSPDEVNFDVWVIIVVLLVSLGT